MKDSLTPPQSSPPPQPVAPKDSLSVEVEEIRRRYKGGSVISGGNRYGKMNQVCLDLAQLLSIVEDLQSNLSSETRWAHQYFTQWEAVCKEMDELQKTHPAGYWRFATAELQQNVQRLKAQLRRKDEVLATAQSKIRRFEEAISSSLDDARRGYEEDIVLGGNDAKYFQWIINCFEKIRVALADGKEGGR